MQAVLTFTNLGYWGLIPDFLSVHDPRSAVDQIHDNYHHGGGWRDWTQGSIELVDEGPGRAVLRLGGEEFPEVARGRLRNERLYLFDCSFVAVWPLDGGALRVARVD